MTQQVTTQVGRIVWGNPLVGRQKEKDGQKLFEADGKTPIMEYSFGLAIAKEAFNVPGMAGQIGLGDAMQAEAKALYPQGAPADFAYKFKDGDTALDSKQKPLKDKDGYAGCYVISVSSSFPIKVVRRDGGAFVAMTDGVKTGDFARVALNVVGHGPAPNKRGAKPGLYLNPTLVEFAGYGQPIAGGANPDDVFGAPLALPPGASMTPPAGGAMPSAPQAPTAAPAASQAPVQPHADLPWGPKG